MNKNSLLFRIILGITASLALVAIIISGLSIYTTRNYFTENTEETLSKNYQGMVQVLDIYKKNARAHVDVLAKNEKIIDAAKRRDVQSLFAITIPLMKDAQVDYLVVTDSQGKVLVRAHQPDKIPDANDSIASQKNVKEAMGGKSFVGIEEGKTVKLSVRAGAPLYDQNGTLVGVISSGYVVSKNMIVDQAKDMFDSDFTLFLQDERVATTLSEDNGTRLTGSKIDNQEVIQAVLNEGKEFHGVNKIAEHDYAVVYGPLMGTDGNPIGIIFSGKPISKIEAITNHMIYETIGSSLVVLLFVLAVTIYFTRKLLAPIQMLLIKFREIAGGNLGIAPLTIESKDEIGQLAVAFNTMLESLRSLVGRVAHSAEQVAASSEELTASADQTAQATEQVAISITEVANGSDKQVKSVDSATVVVENMSKAIGHIAVNSKEMAGSADAAAAAAESGGKMVNKAIEQIVNIEKTVTNSAQVVAELGRRSEEIGQIVDTITGIAGQTNLLALNAAIEAARAGEQGRGFAVVAEEVRKLAEQSEESAKQIASLIGGIQQDTQKAVVAMDQGTHEVKVGTEVVQNAGKSFAEIETLVAQVSGQVGKISAAIQEMAKGSEQIVLSMKDIDEISKETAAHTQTVSAATEEQSAAMEQIAASSQALAKMAEELQSTLNAFKM